MKIKAFSLLMIMVSFSTFAQKSVGFRGSLSGSTVTKFDLIENITPDFKLNIAGSGAVFFELPITNNFSIQPELVYTQKGFAIKEGIKMASEFAGVDIPLNGKVNFKTNYVEIPVLAKIHFGDKNSVHSYLMFGPAVGYLADAGLRIRVLSIFPINTNLPKAIFKPYEFSGIAAAGFEFPISGSVKIFTEARYQHGFSRILDTPIVKVPVRNQTFSAGMGLKINI
jgi:Outer membrane protein beta-barrel domain